MSNNSSFWLNESSTDRPAWGMACLVIPPSSSVLTAYLITNILVLLPICTFILCHGVRQWWRRRRTASAPPLSHCNCLTYHMVAMELLGMLAGGFLGYGLSTRSPGAFLVSQTLFIFMRCGQTFFHTLTCVERYLAVVHPLTYRRLRTDRGARIRNAGVGAAWLLSAAGIVFITRHITFAFDIVVFASVLAVVSFCSVSALCVLNRPGPGERGGARRRVDQSRQKALYTMVVIMGVLVFRFACNLVYTVLLMLDVSLDCMIQMCNSWFSLPTSLVLPLLYLHREGKLPCCTTAD